MNWYEAKQQARKERMEARAERLKAEAAAKYNSGMNDLKAIPFGQPILVGHYSEKRDRNYRRNAIARIDKGIELHNLAEQVASRAAAVGSGGISSDDPNAVSKLREKLAKLEADQARMVAANKVGRKFKWKASPEAIEAMQAVGIPANAAARLFEADCCGRYGFPAYAISNNNANINRIKKRIAHLERLDEAREARPEPVVQNRDSGIKIVENLDINRLQIVFPGKPTPVVIKACKSYGFRWSPSEGAWQRHYSNAAKWAAEQVIRIAEGEA